MTNSRIMSTLGHHLYYYLLFYTSFFGQRYTLNSKNQLYNSLNINKSRISGITATFSVGFKLNFALKKATNFNTMEENILMNEYRNLHDADKSKWKQLTSISEFIWDGVYSMRLVTEDSSLGLPFNVVGTEFVNIVVKDQTRDANTQNDRIIVQTLTRVDRATGDVLTYTRSRRYSNGEHKWSDWKTTAGGTGIVNQTDTVVCIMPNVLNLWDEVCELEIMLAEPADKSIVNEYMIQFTSGEVATTLILPSEIKWMSTPTIQSNKVYQISIVNNLAVMGEFSNE